MPRLLHASGRYDEKPGWLKRDLDRWTDLAGIVTLTEVADPERKQALERPGWTVVSGRGEGEGECAILFRDDMWKCHALTVNAITLGGGRARLKAPLYATSVVLQRRGTGRLLIVSTTHMPAHVETLLRLRTKVAPATTWREAAQGWAGHVKAMRRRFPDAEVALLADWNVDARKQWAREMVREEFAAAGRDLRVVAPAEGTHYRRVIDFALTTLRPNVVNAIHAEASDHRAVKVHAPWPVDWKRR